MTATTGQEARDPGSRDSGSDGADRWPRRRRVTPVSVALTATLVLAAASCSSSPSEGALQGKSATAILSISVSAYHRQKSVHFVTKTVAGAANTVEVGATSGSAAIETVTSGTTPVLQAVLKDGTAYLRASSDVLQRTFNLKASTANANAGKWVSMEKGDPGYAAVTESLSTGDAIFQFVPEEPNLKVGGVTQFGGQTAVAVVGSPAGSVSAGTTVRVTMFVSTTAPYLPLGATLQVDNDDGTNIERVATVYGKWTQKVDPPDPQGATPITSLTG